MFSIKKAFSDTQNRLRSLSGEPRQLATGAALGVWVAFLPIVPFQVPLVVLLVWLTRSSLVAAMAMNWLIANPLTLLPIYSLSLLLANTFWHANLDLEYIKTLIEQLQQAGNLSLIFAIVKGAGYNTFGLLLAGSSLLAFPAAAVTYWGLYPFFSKNQRIE